jgi:hypothetical protein
MFQRTVPSLRAGTPACSCSAFMKTGRSVAKPAALRPAGIRLGPWSCGLTMSDSAQSSQSAWPVPGLPNSEAVCNRRSAGSTPTCRCCAASSSPVWVWRCASTCRCGGAPTPVWQTSLRRWRPSVPPPRRHALRPAVAAAAGGGALAAGEGGRRRAAGAVGAGPRADKGACRAQAGFPGKFGDERPDTSRGSGW